MGEDRLPDSKKHTIVCNEAETHRTPDARADAYLALINHHVEKDPRPHCEIAELLGVSRRQLGRMLGGQRPLRLAELKALTEMFEIDHARATIAIEVMGDWESYDDPALSLIIRLLKPVVLKLGERADFPIEPLTNPAQDTLSDWLANTIIANEEQIRNRRDGFIKLPEI